MLILIIFSPSISSVLSSHIHFLVLIQIHVLLYHCYYMHVRIHILNVLSLYEITCVYVFRADPWVLDNDRDALVCLLASSLFLLCWEKGFAVLIHRHDVFKTVKSKTQTKENKKSRGNARPHIFGLRVFLKLGSDIAHL